MAKNVQVELCSECEKLGMLYEHSSQNEDIHLL